MTTRPSSPPAQDASIPFPPTVRAITRRGEKRIHRVGKENENQRGIEVVKKRKIEKEREGERERESE